MDAKSNAVFDRIPPQNIEAEQAVIGCMLLDNRTIPVVREIVDKTNFLRLAHQRIFEAACDVFDRNESVDLLMLFDELRRRKQLDEIGSGELTVEYIGDVVDAVPTSVNADRYAEIVASRATARQVIHIAMEMARRGWDESGPPEEILADIEVKIIDAIRNSKKSELSVTIQDACLSYVNSLRSGRSRVFGSGLIDLDNAIGGAGVGEMIVLAARPSHGKSAFAIEWLHNASAAGIPTAIISEEMDKAAIGKRSMLRFSSYDQDLWNSDTADHLEQEIRKHYANAAPIYVAENCHTINKAEAAIRRFADNGVKIVAVDYLQLLDGSGNKRYEQVGDVSRRLKLAAQKNEVAIIALCQLNRGIEERKVFQPMLRDLKDSGQIEQDADAILFLIWPWANWNESQEESGRPRNGSSATTPEPDKNEYRIMVGKNCRNRRTKKRRILLHFDCERMTFKCYSTTYAEADQFSR